MNQSKPSVVIHREAEASTDSSPLPIPQVAQTGPEGFLPRFAMTQSGVDLLSAT